MTGRKDAVSREKDLRLAIFRIERGRADSKATKLSVASVAREAGISPALIHNHYPVIAELIRVKRGASSRQQRDAKQEALAVELQKNADLRREVLDLKGRLAQLATVNEMLVVENEELRAKTRSDNIVEIGKQR